MRRRTNELWPEPDMSGDGLAGSVTVVIGIDGTSMSWGAFSWGCGEARRLGGRAVAVLVSSPTAALTAGLCTAASLAGVIYPEPDPTAIDQVEALVAEMRREAPGLELAVIRAPGNPVAELLRIAEEVHADLIVVGGSTASPHRFAGLIGYRLAARRRRPVIVAVPPDFETPDLP